VPTGDIERSLELKEVANRGLIFWRYPSLSDGTFDDVSLNPFALWASERSQVFAPHAGLNCR
jgi:hypothetical protein